MAALAGTFTAVIRPTDPAQQAQPVVVTAQDVQRLPISPGGLVVQPDQGWVLVNIDTIVWTEASAQTFNTVVLDTPVEVRVTPVDFTWDFGDGSAPVRTTDPGRPYPNHTVSHIYSRAAENLTVTCDHALGRPVPGGRLRRVAARAGVRRHHGDLRAVRGPHGDDGADPLLSDRQAAIVQAPIRTRPGAAPRRTVP